MTLTTSISTFKPRFLIFAVAVVFFLFFTYVHVRQDGTSVGRRPGIGLEWKSDGEHPIDELIRKGQDEWRDLLSKKSHGLAEAAAKYRARRGRHPPPGFAEWFKYAQERDAVIVEDFFDQIYHDLAPYWAIQPRVLRSQAKSISTRVVVRDHNATIETDFPRVWMDAWGDLIQSIAGHLPDVDIPINTMDESRIVVPWETLKQYMEKERASRVIVRPDTLITEYMNLSTEAPLKPSEHFDPDFSGPDDGSFWEMVRVGCPENSPALHSEIEEIDFSSLPAEFYNYLHLSYHGYLKNWTQSKDLCIRPELEALHGSFIEPISISTSHRLFPLFGGSKLSVNNEILLPPAMYWADDELYSGGSAYHGGDWGKKKNIFIWRGAATGGRNRDYNWRGFQRHRFLSMLNATDIRLIEAKKPYPGNFALPNYDDYHLQSGNEGRLPEFLEEYTDIGFVHLVCFPYDAQNPHCPYTEPYFELKKGLPMKEQYDYKYLPDIDGNSFSGRYRGFLLSTSLPIKATIYNEWHDSRLVPWAHFVPMDSTFMDIYGIMEYFVGYKGKGSHDLVGRKIALDGKKWAETVLRKEDMQIYTYRLLLEYARISDDSRDVLGFADDLKDSRRFS